MARAVLDTNVIISALISDKGAPRRIFGAWLAGRFTLVTSPSIIAEADRALHYHKIRHVYGLSEEEIATAIALLWSHGQLTPDAYRIERAAADPDDDKFLACALEGAAEFIVTGDKELLSLGAYRSTRIVTPAEFLRILETS
ncbi:MAG TPA: putative toxin-antitoxin system toxin component, PIN family [Dehalococcoidia bacterium]|nr:putative toxin-antitoxin system toxin component, PIN family [Dehalococcoidia bacterium]